MSACLLPVILPRERLHSKHALPTPGAPRLLAFANAGPSPGKPSPTTTFSSHSLIQQRFIEHPLRTRNISAGPNPSQSSMPSELSLFIPQPVLVYLYTFGLLCSGPEMGIQAWFPFTAHPRRANTIISMHPGFQTRCYRCTVSPKCRIPGSGEKGPRCSLGE